MADVLYVDMEHCTTIRTWLILALLACLHVFRPVEADSDALRTLPHRNAYADVESLVNDLVRDPTSMLAFAIADGRMVRW
jgi:hypothetical protein